MSYMSGIYDPNKHKIYTPINKHKYKGIANPVCRSSWEYDFCRLLDSDNNVLEWSSEAVQIPYMINGKRHRYFPDFSAVLKLKNGGIKKIIYEIKPYTQTQPPKTGKNKARKTILNERKTFQKNIAKWKAAQRYCNKLGYEFKIITEKQLYK